MKEREKVFLLFGAKHSPSGGGRLAQLRHCHWHVDSALYLENDFHLVNVCMWVTVLISLQKVPQTLSF